MDLSYWVLWGALVKHKTCKVEGLKGSKENDEMYGLSSIWGLTEWKPCSTGKVWLTGDILEGYVFLNSLEEVSKNQLPPSCTSSCAGREREVSRSCVLKNQGCWSFQSTCSALSKYCKFCASTTSFGEELYRSTTSYNNLSPFVFWLWSSAQSNLTRMLFCTFVVLFIGCLFHF